ncbi:MAG TPA: M15 family metallopeptidase [Vicinamibacteria bacterium]
MRRGLLLLTLALGAAPAGASARPPRAAAAARAADLVDLAALDPTIKLEIRYATANNFLGRPVYPEARAWLQRDAAAALRRAQRALREKGHGLLVFDAYRPWSVTRLFWEATPKAKRAFVANPRVGSKHNRGTAVDLTLYDLATGREVEMPSAYDEFSERAAPGYAGGPPAARAARDRLRAAMEGEGFTVEPNEWWHYNWKDWRSYPVLDVPFRSLPPSPR